MSGQTTASWYLLRILLALLVFAPTLGCNKGKKTHPARTEETKETSPPPEVLPPLADWSQTSVPGVEIAAAEPDRIVVQQFDSKAELPNGAEAIGPVVSIEPEIGAAPPQRIRMRLPEGVSLDAEQQKRLSLACYSIAISTSQETLSGAWYMHAAKYDPATRTVEADVGHASLWLITVNPDEQLPAEILTDHCRIHVPATVSHEIAVVAADALEKAYAQLESFGLRAGRGKTNRLDVYFREIPSKSGDAVYAGHQITTTGGSHIVLNLPSKIPNFSIEELRASAGHEMFHEFQLKYQNINTFLDVWVSGTQQANQKLGNFLDTYIPGHKKKKEMFAPPAWLKEKIFKLTDFRFPFGWLNEAMSTWYQLKCAPKWIPDTEDSLYGWSGKFLIGGMVHVDSKDVGYGGAVFIDYLVARCGPAVLREILEACQRQGRNRDPLAAVKEACQKIGVARQDPSLVVFNDVWFHFAGNLLLADAKPPFNDRLNRNRMITANHKLQTIMVADTPIRRKWTLWV